MPFSRSFSSKSLQKGQTLLIIVLVMVVAITVVLSVATRSITNTRISSDEENSQRAFSAAEAGVERVLKTAQDVSSDNKVTLDNNAKFFATVNRSQLPNVLLNGGQTVLQDEGVDLWLSNYDPNPSQNYSNPQTGTYKVRWENTGGNCSSSTNRPPAIEVVVLSGNSTDTAKATHFVFDSCSNRRSTNNFTQATTDSFPITSYGVTVSFDYSGTFSVTNGYIARIVPLYAKTKIGVSNVGGANLPMQGNLISSTGSSGGTSRKITVFQQYPSLPIEVFPYAIFAP